MEGDQYQRKIDPQQLIDDNDIAAVVEVLQSDWLTTGPKVAEFELAVADFVGAKEAVAVSSGTAALHSVIYAIGIGQGDEVILSPLTFAATANAVVYQRGTPVFADVDWDTLLIDPDEVETKVSPRTKAIIAVDYGGQPCDYDALYEVARRHDLFLIADGCHSLGAEYKGRKVGTLADLTAFSFHPVKHITTGEGGMITTDNPALAQTMRLFRNHGIDRNPDRFTRQCSPFTVHRSQPDHGQRNTDNGLWSTPSWYYEMVDLGYNYRITDFQCALGMNQLQKLPGWLARRQEIASSYNAGLSNISAIEPLGIRSDVYHAYHLYVVRLNLSQLAGDRDMIFSTLRAEGIGINVHYIPVYLHPFYRKRFGGKPGLCPVAEAAYHQILSLPVCPRMSTSDVEKVIAAVRKVVEAYIQ